jgi:cytochrome oxidase Cu insertion factor (SCO1/SenC/PrrC family)
MDNSNDPKENQPDSSTCQMLHPCLIGLTGSAAAVHQVAEAHRVYYARVDFEKSKADYTVDHSAFIYLMNRDGRYLGFFPLGASPDKIAAMIGPHLAP